MTDMPLKLMQKHNNKLLNLAYGRVVRRRVEYHEACGTTEKAKDELKILQQDLAKRGVNSPVIKSYATLQASIGTGAAGQKPAAGKKPAAKNKPAAVRPPRRPRRRSTVKPRARSR